MEFQLGISSQIFKEKSHEAISYEEHGDYLSRLRCLRSDSSADDTQGYKKQYKSFEKTCEQISIHSQETIHLRIDVKDFEIIEQ
jgi:hypothetical protein